MLSEGLLHLLNDTIRLRIAAQDLVIFVWFAVWAYRFINDYRKGGNGATLGLIVFFTALAIMYLNDAFGFIYLSFDSWHMPFFNSIFLSIAEISGLAVIAALVLLQWKFTKE